MGGTHKQQQHGGNRFLGFQPVTLVPFEPDLILSEMMTSKQVRVLFTFLFAFQKQQKFVLLFLQLKWLNDYHQLVRRDVGAELERQNRTKSRGCWPWLLSKTLPLPDD